MLPGISSLLRIIPQVLKNGKTRFLLIHSLPFSHSLNPDRVFRIRGLIPPNLRVAGGGIQQRFELFSSSSTNDRIAVTVLWKPISQVEPFQG